MTTTEHTIRTQAALDYTVTPEAVTTAGAISYWRLSGPIKLDALATAWKAAGLAPVMLPNPPGADVALGRAVHEETGIVQVHAARKSSADMLDGVHRWLVRPLARRGAWALVEETVTKERVEFATLLTVKSGPTFERVDANPVEYDAIVDRIRANYDKRQGEIEPNDVSSWLVKIATKLQSVPLRDTGGIYFVPRKDVEIWRKVVKTIQSVSDHRVFQIPALKNSEAIDAITDAITQEVDSITATMEAELTRTGEERLGNRAIQTRKKECEMLLAKVAAYDELLGVQLKCRERVENLEAMIATAALAAS